jgi:hypothetical protein
VLVALTLLSWLSHPSASSADSSAAIAEHSSVRVDGRRATVDVQDATLSDVLGAIASRAGIELVLHGSADEKISARFHSLPLDEALRRLTKGNFLLLYSSDGEGRVLEVWSGDARMPDWPTSSEVSRHDPSAPMLSSANSRVASLLGALRGTDAEQRKWAVWELGDYKDVTARAALMTALKTDPDAEVRQRAAWVLEFQKGPDAVSALIQALSRDPDESVRQRAVESLANIEGQDAVTVLTLALRDPARFVRYEAVTALGEIDSESARASLRAVLSDPEEFIRETAAELLAAGAGAD